MHDNRVLTEQRVERFVRDHLGPAIYRHTAPVKISRWDVPREPVPFEIAVRREFQIAAIGDRWGRPWSTTWFHVEAQVPPQWHAVPGSRVELAVDLGFHGPRPGFQSEALVYTPSGETVKAIEPRNTFVPVDHDTTVDLYIEAGANPDFFDGEFGENATFAPSRLGEWDTAGDEPLYALRRLELALRDDTVWELIQDVWTLTGLMAELPIELPRRHEILRALEHMVDVVDPADVGGTAAAGRAALADVLARPAYASAHRLTAIGHAHIDSAWLWPVRETIRKCARTFSNVLRLMDEDPQFQFAASSAQHYSWMKEHYPRLFERIKEKVAIGQFIPVGGMWVESDTNLPGGEAMVRQFLRGKRFFIEHFGVDSQEVWLPDSFGYSAALPQIARLAGARWFLTQKISWNQVNVMPHHTFRWEGIDGTRIFTHFPPADTYIAELSGRELAHAQANFREKGMATMSLIPFGWGDGGGGPTREHMAAARRTASLEGSPTVRVAAPAAFFAQAEEEYPDPPVWSGELYLELHRGTYTSQANTKQGNRRSEHLLREAELWATTACVRVGADYPYDVLESSWETVLLQQFHDVLTGTAIAWVHREAEENYARVSKLLDELIHASLEALVGPGDTDLLANAGPMNLMGVAALAVGPAGDAGAGDSAKAEGESFVLDNGLVRAVIDQRGLLVSLIDHASGREAIAPGRAGNLLQLHRDMPNNWDAWDIDEFYRRSVSDLVEAESVALETHDDGAAVVVRRSFGTSTITQRISLGAHARSLSIVNDIDWRESEKVLKLAFPLDVRTDRFASEIQFGHVYRPTHTNTSWDAARFETVAHRWVHVGEPEYGIAVSNDSTYGHDVSSDERLGGGAITTVRLSLLRAPRFPDPHTDSGLHRLAVTIRPGASIADAIHEGYALNTPPRRLRGAGGIEPLVFVDHPAVLVESVKLAEDRSGDVIVRLYESLGTRARATVDARFDHVAVQVADLIERPLADAGLTHRDGRIQLDLRPFEIVTLRYVRSAD